jgi:hypothetical protein
LHQIEDHVSDQDQPVLAFSNTLKMDTHASTVHLELLPHKETLDVLLHQLALEPDNTSVIKPTVTNADNAKPDI